jgi:hypothetical protein
MQKTKATCAVSGCDAMHSSWQHWEVTCVHCETFVCRDDYRELPVVELFMTRTRECPNCHQPMEG